MPPLRFFRSQLAQHEAPAVIYYIRGNSSVHNGTEKFYIQFIDDGSLTPSAAENIYIPTDANGDFEYQYNGKKIYSLETFKNESKTTLLSIELTEDLNLVTKAVSMFEGCTNLASASFPNATFNNCTDARAMFFNTKIVNLSLPEATFVGLVSTGEMFVGMPQLETISLPKASFANMTNNGGVGGGADYGIFYNCPKLQSVSLPEATFASLQVATGMFWKCTLLQSVSMPKATFASLQVAKGMFNACSNLESVSWPQATFANLQNANGMFAYCAKLTTIEWSAALNLNNITSLGNTGGSGADNYGIFTGCSTLPNSAIAPFANFTFANCTQMINAFAECYALTKIDLHSATFANLTNCWAAFYNSYNVAEIDLSSATFAKVSTTVFLGYNAFQKLNALTTLKVPTNSTAILSTSTPSAAPMYLGNSQLTYQSMLKVANWLSDLTGQSAHTCTFKASAWNALTAAEQSNIDTILSGKNWTRAIA